MADTDQFTDEDIFARTLNGEAANQGYEGQCAVANVILNRVALEWQGETTIRGICLHRLQFSCWNGTNATNPDRARIMSDTHSASYRQCLSIARLAMANQLDDNTNGSDSYEVTGTPAYWVKGLTPRCVIGHHSFYATRTG